MAITPTHKYRGKYPNRIVSVGSRRDAAGHHSTVVVQTNAGEVQEFTARDLGLIMPRCGVELNHYRAVAWYCQAARAYAGLLGATSERIAFHKSNALEHAQAITGHYYDFVATVYSLEMIARDHVEAVEWAAESARALAAEAGAAPAAAVDLAEKGYLVTWRIDICASSPREAAEKARAIQQRADSIATVFEVVGEHERETIDLTPEGEG